MVSEIQNRINRTLEKALESARQLSFPNFWRNEMNLQQLKYLVEIADCHSITRASKRLFVSQPYLSKVVSDFEARVNKQIFTRHSSGLELTAYGHKVYLLARSILHQMEQLEDLESGGSHETTGAKLSFSVSNLILKDSLLLEYFASQRVSRSEVDLFETTIEEAVQQVEENNSEFAILVVDDFQKDLLKAVTDRKGLEWMELDKGDLYCHFSRNHFLAETSKLSLEELTRYPLVRLKADKFTAFSREKFQEAHPFVEASKCFTVNHYHSFLNVVKNSGAFMIGNKWQISELEKMGIQSVRLPHARVKVHLLVLKKEVASFSAEAKKMLQLFKNSYGLEKT